MPRFITSRLFDEDATRQGIAGLGNPTLAHGCAARMLGRYQSEIRHQLARVLEPREVADLGNDGDGYDQANAAQLERENVG